MGVAEPVAECQPRICDGRKPDIGVMSEPVQEESNLIADPPKISDQDTDQVNNILGLDLNHKPTEQRRAGRDDGLPPARRIIGRKTYGQVPANAEHL